MPAVLLSPSPSTALARPYVILTARLLVGLLQGVALYALQQAATEHQSLARRSHFFVPLFLLTLWLPLLWNSALGHLRWRQSVYWSLLLLVLLTFLGVYDAWRSGASAGVVQYPSVGLLLMSFAGLYVAQALVLAGASERRCVASYPACFETAWKLLVQAQFGVVFVVVLWWVLLLGALLFALVDLNGPERLLSAPWFPAPVSLLALSCALHITDVRPSMVQGIRTLLLHMLSWLLPLAALAVAGFLLVLPWTGLAPLWATGHATEVMLGAAVVLLLLINATVQDGRPSCPGHPLLHWSARSATLCLLPLVLIAAYAMGLRVAEHGWTAARIRGAAAIALLIGYAAGYAWAALRAAAWTQRLAQVNIFQAYAMLLVALALHSPLADPARLSVNHQMSRLESGRVAADQFDYNYLRVEGRRYGREALERLRSDPLGDDPALVRSAAAQVLLHGLDEYSANVSPGGLATQLHVWPAGGQLPESFLAQDWRALNGLTDIPACLRQPGTHCDVYPRNIHGGRTAQAWILVIGRTPGSGAALLRERTPGHWESAGTLESAVVGCAALGQQLQSGAGWQLAPSSQRDLRIGQQHLPLRPPSTLARTCADFTTP